MADSLTEGFNETSDRALSLDPGMVLNSRIGKLGGLNLNPAISFQASGQFINKIQCVKFFGSSHLILANNDDKDFNALFNPAASPFALLINSNITFDSCLWMPISITTKANYNVKRFAFDSLNHFHTSLLNFGVGFDVILSRKYLSLYGGWECYKIIQGVQEFKNFQAGDRIYFENFYFGVVSNLEFEGDPSNRIQLKLNFIGINSRNQQFLKTQDSFLVFVDVKYLKNFFVR